MTVLLVKYSAQNIYLSIYKLYNKKSFARITAIMNLINLTDVELTLITHNKPSTEKITIHFSPNTNLTTKLQSILNHEKLVRYEFKYIINKIHNGGNLNQNLSIFNPKTYNSLIEIDKSPIQITQLEIANFFNSYYKQSITYFIFDSTFYNTAHLKLNSYLECQINSESGILIENIINNLIRQVSKIEAKKCWLIINIDALKTTFTIINKLKCVTSHKLLLFLNNTKTTDFDINSDNENHKYAISKLAQITSQLITIHNGIFGIIISGEIGYTNYNLRASFLAQLKWSDIFINAKANKTNNYIISRERSRVKILLAEGNEDEEILNKLTELI